MLTLTPAYGRDYKTAKAVRADWEKGKDFIISNFFHKDDGRYANKEDMARAGETAMIRYSNLTKTVVIK